MHRPKKQPRHSRPLPAAAGSPCPKDEPPNWRRICWTLGSVLGLGLVFSVFIVIDSLPHWLTADDRSILAHYEEIRGALAHDDLPGAKRAAVAISEQWPGRHQTAEAARQLAGSESLETARAAFSAMSAEAVKLAAHNRGFYVMHCKMPCPMDCSPCLTVGMGRWIQRAPLPENPFMGLAQLRCGVVDASATFR